MADDMTNEITEELSSLELEKIYLRQRVRLFDLRKNETEWRERGIGPVSTYFNEMSNESFMLVKSETDGSMILESKIHTDTAYRKQQDRFIIWTENDLVLGLSFQQTDGCIDIWEFICQVQGKNPFVLIGEEPDSVVKQPIKVIVAAPTDNVAQRVWYEQMLDIERVELSAYETDVLRQLIHIVNRLVVQQPDEKVSLPPESELLDLFPLCEDINAVGGLQHLHETILYLLSFNRRRY